MAWNPNEHARRADHYLDLAASTHDGTDDLDAETVAQLTMWGTLAVAHALRAGQDLPRPPFRPTPAPPVPPPVHVPANEDVTQEYRRGGDR